MNFWVHTPSLLGNKVNVHNINNRASWEYRQSLSQKETFDDNSLSKIFLKWDVKEGKSLQGSSFTWNKIISLHYFISWCQGIVSPKRLKHWRTLNFKAWKILQKMCAAEIIEFVIILLVMCHWHDSLKKASMWIMLKIFIPHCVKLMMRKYKN